MRFHPLIIRLSELRHETRYLKKLAFPLPDAEPEEVPESDISYIEDNTDDLPLDLAF